MPDAVEQSRIHHPALRTLPPTFHPTVQDASQPVEELLPFTVRLVNDEAGLQKAIKVRHEAYKRHLPEFAQSLKNPEPADFEQGVVVLVAESKLDGSGLGTMRIQCNTMGPLELEKSLTLPNWLKNCRTAEATRLAIFNDKQGRMVKSLIFKAYYQYCLSQAIDWMIIAGRSPLDKMYERLHFADVFPELGYISLTHAGNLPHRIMALQVKTVEPLWAAANHPLHTLFFKRSHADLILNQ